MTAYVCGKDDPVDFDTFMALYTAVKLGGDDEEGQQLCRDAFQRVDMTIRDVRTLIDFDPQTLGFANEGFDAGGRRFAISIHIYEYAKVYQFVLSWSFINVGGMDWLKAALKKREKIYATSE